MRLIDWIYPVGHVMITVNPYNDPNKIFKTHSWIRFAQGKTLVGVDPSDVDFKTAEKTGGEKKHTLTESEMPAHYHNLQHTGNTSVMYVKGNVGSGNEYAMTLNGESQYGAGDMPWGGRLRGEPSGGNQSHNNMPPYITVYFWRRVG